METYQEIAQPMESFVNRMLSHYGIAVMIKDEQTKKNIIESVLPDKLINKKVKPP